MEEMTLESSSAPRSIMTNTAKTWKQNQAQHQDGNNQQNWTGLRVSEVDVRAMCCLPHQRIIPSRTFITTHMPLNEVAFQRHSVDRMPAQRIA
mmetsp:Transcript_16271/g.37386  ORF Transcript_16271/g.37386 Transcript_16271/m.37386 type:complete len:93 (-) Transcript_16271:46-324(-)